MNKLFTKIATLSVGLAMAIGVGVAVGSRQEAKPIYADSGDELTFDANSETSVDYESAWEYAFTQGANGNAPAAYSDGIRVYNAKGTNKYGGHLTLSPKSGNDSGYITSVVITVTSTYNPTIKVKAGDTASAMSSATESSLTDSSTVYTYTASGTSTRYIEFTSWGNNSNSYVQWRVKKLQINYTLSGGASSDWETSAIAISKTTALASTIYNTAEEFPTLSDVTVTKTEHDNNGVAADRDTDVTATSTLHWVYASNGNAVTLPLANGEYNVKIWASVTGETLTTKDNATPAKQYVSGTLTVTDEPAYVVVDATVTSGNMSGNNDANTKYGLSATEWSIVGTKQSASNLPGFGSDGTTRLYGNASGGNYIVFKTLKAHRSIVKASIEFNGNYYTGATVKQGEGTSGTTISESNGFYTFANDTTAFTLVNTNSSTTQVRFDTIHIYYEDEVVTTPSLTITGAPSQVGVGTNTASFTVEYANLSENFSVSTTAAYLTASYTAAKGTGTATVYLSGVSAVNSTTVSVSSTGAETQSFSVQVKVLPIIDASFNSLNWGSTTYATSPHTVTWNSPYDCVVSAGQLNGGTGYLGTNSGNSGKLNVSGNDWTLKDSAIDAAIVADGSAAWSTHGQALYMSNFGVVHPTEFVVKAANTSNGYTATYYILVSTDSGDSWSVLSTGTVATETNMSWTGNSYSSNSNPIQFAFVTTSTSYGTISNITVEVSGDSYATTKVLDSIYVSGTPTTSYTAGESFDLGSAKVYARYTDSTTYPDEDITSHVSFSAIVHGTTEVTITYLNKTTTVAVSVSDVGDVYKKVTSINELLELNNVLFSLFILCS